MAHTLDQEMRERGRNEALAFGAGFAAVVVLAWFVWSFWPLWPSEAEFAANRQKARSSVQEMVDWCTAQGGTATVRGYTFHKCTIPPASK